MDWDATTWGTAGGCVPKTLLSLFGKRQNGQNCQLRHQRHIKKLSASKSESHSTGQESSYELEDLFKNNYAKFSILRAARVGIDFLFE